VFIDVENKVGKDLEYGCHGLFGSIVRVIVALNHKEGREERLV
jgi:hypothetical protein